jgi:histidinol-phosphate/aromatic aminotransferase/cobyric acid decarboxylase-like protein
MDLGLFRQGNHSPSFSTLARSMGGAENVVDFCIPCNPYFPTPDMFGQLSSSLESMLKYYPSDANTITGQLATVIGLPPQTIAMGNGSTELITWIDHLLVKESIAIPVPTFGRWTDQPLETGKRVDMFRLHEATGFALDIDQYISFIRAKGSRVAVICNPNNPDGGYLPHREVIRFMDELSDLDLVIIDESFIDFVDCEAVPSVAAEAMLRSNVLVLKSLGKNFGLHGIRFGYVVGNPSLVQDIRKYLPKWNLNSLAEAVVFMLRDHLDSYRISLQLLARDRYEMMAELHQIPGMLVYASQANFVLVKLPPGADGGMLRDYLLSQHGVLVRECGNKLGITSQFVRLVVRPRADTQRLIAGIYGYLGLPMNNPGEAAARVGGYPTPDQHAGRYPELGGPAPALPSHAEPAGRYPEFGGPAPALTSHAEPGGGYPEPNGYGHQSDGYGRGNELTATNYGQRPELTANYGQRPELTANYGQRPEMPANSYGQRQELPPTGQIPRPEASVPVPSSWDSGQLPQVQVSAQLLGDVPR